MKTLLITNKVNSQEHERSNNNFNFQGIIVSAQQVRRFFLEEIWEAHEIIEIVGGMLTVKVAGSGHTLGHIFTPILLPINQSTDLDSAILGRVRGYGQTNGFINNLIYLTVPKQSNHQTRLKYDSFRIKVHMPVPHGDIVSSRPWYRGGEKRS